MTGASVAVGAAVSVGACVLVGMTVGTSVGIAVGTAVGMVVGTGVAPAVAVGLVWLSAVVGVSGVNWTMITLSTQQLAMPIPVNNNQRRHLLFLGVGIVFDSCMVVLFLLKGYLLISANCIITYKWLNGAGDFLRNCYLKTRIANKVYKMFFDGIITYHAIIIRHTICVITAQ